MSRSLKARSLTRALGLQHLRRNRAPWRGALRTEIRQKPRDLTPCKRHWHLDGLGGCPQAQCSCDRGFIIIGIRRKPNLAEVRRHEANADQPLCREQTHYRVVRHLIPALL